MAFREQDDLPYRSPITANQQKPEFTKDEANYDTLVMVVKIFNEAIEGLYKEFNAFDVLKAGTDQEVIEEMMRKIAGNQVAYDILSPLKERLDSAILTADQNHVRRNS
jgi:hypothetical protein